MLGFCDKMLEFFDIDVFVDKIEEIINDVKLIYILIYYFGFVVYFDYNVMGVVII